MKIRDADGTVFDLPKHVATGLARSASNTFQLVVDEPTEAEQPESSVESDNTPRTPAQDVPDGPPTLAWKNQAIAKWAKGHGIDLGGATKKDAMLAAIAAHATAKTAVALDAVLTPAGQAPLIVDEAAPATEDDDELDQVAADVAAALADDEDDNLEPDDPEPEDDQSPDRD